jgi:hypothetical protein
MCLCLYSSVFKQSWATSLVTENTPLNILVWLLGAETYMDRNNSQAHILFPEMKS